MRMKDATGISAEMRAKVYARDSFDGCPCCIICGRPYPQIHHYIERSRGGLGIEENLVCLCATCHARLHGSQYRVMTSHIRRYLMNKYPYWNERALIKEKAYGQCEDRNDSQE